jgi:predicted Mrr-cat superfamily restriction endonuclease
MAEQLWVIRAGQSASYVDDFLAKKIVGVDFSELASDDLAAVGEQALKALGTSVREHGFAGQLSAFGFRVDVGDLVIVPRLPKTRDYLVGRITSPTGTWLTRPPSVTINAPWSGLGRSTGRT